MMDAEVAGVGKGRLFGKTAISKAILEGIADSLERAALGHYPVEEETNVLLEKALLSDIFLNRVTRSARPWSFLR